MAFTAEVIPTGGLCVDAELIHISFLTQHLLRAFNCILTHYCEYIFFFRFFDNLSVLHEMKSYFKFSTKPMSLKTYYQWLSGFSVWPQVTDLQPQMILSPLDKYCSAVFCVRHALIFPYYLIHHSFLKKAKSTQVQLLITQHVIYHLLAFGSLAHSTEACSSAAVSSDL